MHYRSIPDLAAMLQHQLHRLPRETDLVVGLPGGGQLVANLACLLLNVPMSDLPAFVEGRRFSVGRTKAGATPAVAARHVLVLGESDEDAAALRAARAEIAARMPEAAVTFALAYAGASGVEGADLVLEVLPQPRIFQWSFMSHLLIERACVDIDGVLCLDPTEAENDDGANYLQFLSAARPLYRPTRRIGTLVTSRLEKYRPQTEAWLAARGIAYGRLVMLDLPSREERLRLAAHGRFKAEVYRASDAPLFIESEHRQARRIVEEAEKPVLCLETHRLLTPESLARDEAPTPAPMPLRRAKGLLRQVLGPERTAALKRRLPR